MARSTAMTVPILGMKSGKSRRPWVRLAWVLVVIIAPIVMFPWFEHSQVYHPTRELEVVPDRIGKPFEDVRLMTEDGIQLHGWFFPADSHSQFSQRAFLICHGNGGNISHRLKLCETLLATGMNVFIFDYRGYGRSKGKPGEEGTYRDAVAAHEWLEKKGIRGTNIVVFGESLGGAVAAELALRKTVCGIILQSTFTSIPDIGRELFPWLPVTLLVTIKYDTHGKLPRIHVPVLVMHSRADDLVRFQHSERNFAAANEPKQFCELRGRHNEPAWEQPEFREAIENFLNWTRR